MKNRPDLSSLEFKLHAEELAHLSVPLRIAMAVKHWVAKGLLRADDQLPSSRQLALRLKVARESVEIAYSQLEAEGYLLRRMGSGSFISATAIPQLSGASAVRRRSGPLAVTPVQVLSHRGEAIHSGGGVVDQPVVRPFVAGVPDLRSFPVDIWKKIYSQVLRETGSRALQAGDPAGEAQLRRNIAHHIALQRGVHCSEAQVIVLTSSQQALALTATMLFDEGDAFAIENPCYHGARRAYEANGLKLVPVPVDDNGLRTEILTQLAPARGVYITPSHQYPTGSTLSLERRQALLAWAYENSAWIIEDDYDSEFHYDGHPTSSVQGLDPHERTIYVGTFSKSMFPSLRIGYMVVPLKLVQPMATARTLMDGHCSVIHQLTLSRFIEDGHFSKHVRKMRSVYRARRDAFVFEFAKHLEGTATVTVPKGGLQAACQVADSRSEQAWINMARDQDIDLPRLSRLYIGTPQQFGWLAGFAAYTPDEIRLALIKLKETWRQQRRR